MPRAYSYIRFSRPEQMRGDSYARQLEHAEAWAMEHGVEIDERLTDLGVSAFRGTNSDQGALGKFLEIVRSGQVTKGSVLIVESLDRISRQKILPALKVVTDILEAGIKIVTLSDGYEYTEESANENPFQLIISLTILSRAHEESKTKSLRVAAAWAKKRQAARDERRPMTKLVPEWIELHDGTYSGIPERAEIVRRIFADTIAGIGRDRIARNLNETGVEPWGRGRKRGQGWHDSYVSKILTNPATYGVYQPHRMQDGRRVPDGEPVLNYFPPVVDEATYWVAQAASASRRTSRGRRGKTYANLLSGLAKCGHCGGTMTYVDKGRGPKGGKVKLVCDNKLRGRGCTHTHRYSYQPLEIGVLFNLTRDRLKELACREDSRRTALEAELAAEDAKLQAKKAAVRRLMAVVEAGEVEDEITARVRELNAEAKTLKAEADRIRRELRTVAPSSSDGDRTGELLMELYRQMQAVEGEDRYRLRAELAQHIRASVERVVCEDGSVMLEFKDGMRSALLTDRSPQTGQQISEAEEDLVYLEWPS